MVLQHRHTHINQQYFYSAASLAGFSQYSNKHPSNKWASKCTRLSIQLLACGLWSKLNIHNHSRGSTPRNNSNITNKQGKTLSDLQLRTQVNSLPNYTKIYCFRGFFPKIHQYTTELQGGRQVGAQCPLNLHKQLTFTAKLYSKTPFLLTWDVASFHVGHWWGNRQF